MWACCPAGLWDVSLTDRCPQQLNLSWIVRRGPFVSGSLWWLSSWFNINSTARVWELGWIIWSAMHQGGSLLHVQEISALWECIKRAIDAILLSHEVMRSCLKTDGCDENHPMNNSWGDGIHWTTGPTALHRVLSQAGGKQYYMLKLTLTLTTNTITNE